MTKAQRARTVAAIGVGFQLTLFLQFGLNSRTRTRTRSPWKENVRPSFSG
jgi:hypothetical protein